MQPEVGNTGESALATKPPAARRAAKLELRLLILVLSVGAAALLAEVGLRIFFRNQLGFIEDERSLTYRYHRRLGWFPQPDSRSALRASRIFHVANNSLGFRDAEPMPTTKPAIVFLGDSFTWGYDVEAADASPTNSPSGIPNGACTIWA